MTTATVVLASATVPNVAAARYLADYGDLDDAGVVRAMEQVGMQRWGRRDPPSHLCRIDALAAVIVANDRPRLLVSAKAVDEHRLLRALFAAWPDTPAEIVDWSGATRALLIARAIAHDLRLPAFFENTTSGVLFDHIAPMAGDHPAPAGQIEAEALRLLTGWQPPADDDEPRLAALAAARYRLWLRGQYCRGYVDSRARACLQDRLNEQQAETLE